MRFRFVRRLQWLIRTVRFLGAAAWRSCDAEECTAVAQPGQAFDTVVRQLTAEKAQLEEAYRQLQQQMLANQAGMDLENARLFQESSRRQERLASILEINKRIAT